MMSALMWYCAADTGDLVGTDRCAHAAPADRQATFDLVCRDGAPERYDEVRIIVILGQAVRAEINDLMASHTELPDQLMLQVEAAVIGGDTDTHGASLCRPPEDGALRRDDSLQAVPGSGQQQAPGSKRVSGRATTAT
jgi:hypothetical protein